MPQQLSYLVDLRACQFSDDGTGWIHAMPLGEYMHPQYGKISITPERVQRFAANVTSGVRGQDLDIDYDHKKQTTEAAGWVKNAEARSDGLWLLVEWTQEAWGKIKSKAYRYFSPEMVDEWQHPQTGAKYQDVLFGGGLTNRPFLKGILPINLSELSFDETNQSVGGHMDPKLIRQLLGLPEDATDEQVTSSIQDALKKKADDKDPQLVLTSELIKLAEESPAVKALTEQLKQQETTIGEMRAAHKLSEANADSAKLTEPFTHEGVRMAFSEPVKSALQKVLLLAEGDLRAEIVKLFGELTKGVVILNELGTGHKDGGKDAIKVFSDAVTKIQTERKLSYADASIVAASENPQMFEEYRQASFAGRE